MLQVSRPKTPLSKTSVSYADFKDKDQKAAAGKNNQEMMWEALY